MGLEEQEGKGGDSRLSAKPDSSQPRAGVKCGAVQWLPRRHLGGLGLFQLSSSILASHRIHDLLNRTTQTFTSSAMRSFVAELLKIFPSSRMVVLLPLLSRLHASKLRCGEF